jgi:hydrogenase-4 component B
MIGIFPQTGMRLIAPALGELAESAQAPADWAAPLGQLPIVFALFLALLAAVYVVKSCMQRRVGVRLRETWGCGYAAVTPRMQYTASGFAEELVKLGRPMIAFAVDWNPLRSLAPTARGFRSHCHDRMENGWLALNRAIGCLLGAFRWIQSGNIRHYVLYVFGAVLFYLLCALVW